MDEVRNKRIQKIVEKMKDSNLGLYIRTLFRNGYKNCKTNAQKQKVTDIMWDIENAIDKLIEQIQHEEWLYWYEHLTLVEKENLSKEFKDQERIRNEAIKKLLKKHEKEIQKVIE